MGFYSENYSANHILLVFRFEIHQFALAFRRYFVCPPQSLLDSMVNDHSLHSIMLNWVILVVLIRGHAIVPRTPRCSATPRPKSPLSSALLSFRIGIDPNKSNSIIRDNFGLPPPLFRPVIKPRGQMHSVPFSIFCRIDNSPWSEKIIDSLDDVPLLELAELREEHLESGLHLLEVGFHDQDSENLKVEHLNYEINSWPTIDVLDTEALLLKCGELSEIRLPISVTDLDGDDVSVLYRFDGEKEWSKTTNADWGYFLPAEAFTGRLINGSTGVIELAALDRFGGSEDLVTIPYLVTGDNSAVEFEAKSHQNDDSSILGSLSPGALVGMSVGGVVVMVVGIGIGIMIGKRKKPRSSSTGLIEEE